MSYENDAKLHRDELISFLKVFKHNEINELEIIEESFEKHRTKFFDECKRVNDLISDAESQSDRDGLARDFLSMCGKIEKHIDKKYEFAFVFRDHTKWNKIVFYFPYKLISALYRHQISVVDMESGKEYDIKLTVFESFRIWSNISKSLQEFEKQRHNKVYKELFKL